ncbi:MAG: cysteine desulfurase [Ruminococcus sp.]|nr:cysteine desulfurase [Ruminococcus sp.]
MAERTVYADWSATAKPSKRALEAAMLYLTDSFGNAGAVYSLGRASAKALHEARRNTAALLGADIGEIFFTSGGTESDNLAVKGAAELGAAMGKRHIVTTAFEHHAVLNTCKYLESRGVEVTYLRPDSRGMISAGQVAEAIREDTALVSMMYVNNEIGTIQPVAEAAAICRSRGVLFHTDAVQAAGHLPIDVKALGADLLSVSGHKFGAFKGIGALYVREGVKLPSLIHGGGQESGLRAGTENVAGAVSLSEALAESLEDIEAKNTRILSLRERIIDGLLAVPESRLNGDRQCRAAGNINVSFLGIEGESLLLMLDINGVRASSGSACTSFSAEPSHVLTSIGVHPELAKGSLRLTIGSDTTEADADYIVRVTSKAVAELRSMSPFWQRIVSEGRHIDDLR